MEGAVRVALMFPGQGLARAELVRALRMHDEHPLVAALREILCDVVSAGEWPELDIADTRAAQPAIFVASLLNARHQAQSVRPPAVLGHSLGMITALAFADAYDDEDGLRIAYERGAMCHEIHCRRPGAMASAIRVSDGEAERICRTVSENSGLSVQVAAYNCRGHVVLSGDKAAVDEACRRVVAEGGGVIPLPIGGAFHSELMAAAMPSFGRVLEEVAFRNTEMPVVSCADARPYTDGAVLREQVLRELIEPVRWSDTVGALPSLGIDEAIDVGPGDVLAKIGRRIPGVACRPMDPIPA